MQVRDLSVGAEAWVNGDFFAAPYDVAMAMECSTTESVRRPVKVEMGVKYLVASKAVIREPNAKGEPHTFIYGGMRPLRQEEPTAKTGKLFDIKRKAGN